MPSRPNAIHERIIAVMKRFPKGITSGQIRQELEKEGLRPEDQTHLDRRKRDLRKWFVIEKLKGTTEVDGNLRPVTLYRFKGNRATVVDEGDINIRVRAEVLRLCRERCQMCGKTPQKHDVVLVIDHKKPRSWGGTNDLENLWALCEECNAGKKAYFTSVKLDDKAMRGIVGHESVHVRIGEALKAVGIGKRTPPSLLEVVADQEDWHKRLRELRYPVIGWEIDTVSYKTEGGKKKVDYVLRRFRAWPKDPTGVIRRFERDRKEHNRQAAD
jgi:hypothetical protein